MLPSEIAKSDTEHAHQRAFFQWINLAAKYGFGIASLLCQGEITYDEAKERKYCPIPELSLMHAIPNGGYRRVSEASKLKAEGVKAGVPDTFLPVAKKFNDNKNLRIFVGLYIEFKKPTKRKQARGGLTIEQQNFINRLRNQDYFVYIAYTWYEAANVVMEYYGGSGTIRDRFCKGNV